MSQCFIPAKVTAYYALIRSSLEYCCSIFDPWRVTLTRALDGEGSKFRPHVSSWETVSDDLRFRTLKLGSAWTHCNPPRKLLRHKFVQKSDRIIVIPGFMLIDGGQGIEPFPPVYFQYCTKHTGKGEKISLRERARRYNSSTHR